jgi:hypothetical protein
MTTGAHRCKEGCAPVVSIFTNKLEGKKMKRTITISIILFLFVSINFTLIIGPPSSASALISAQGNPFFSINSIEVTEGTDPQAVFTVSLTYQGSFREFFSSVSYSTSIGSASGSDFQQTSGTASFPPGQGGTVSTTISIPIVDDQLTEEDETFTVTLSNPEPAFIVQGPGTCTIHDNDSGPSGLVILDTQVVEGDSGTTDAVFRVGVNGSVNSAVTVDYATENLSAVAGRDYDRTTGTLTIPAGQRSANIVVKVLGDLLPEWSQGFFVRLSNARGAEISDGEAVCEIRDNDEPEVLTVCASDLPRVPSEEVLSTIRIDRNLAAGDLEIGLVISNRNAANTPPTTVSVSVDKVTGTFGDDASLWLFGSLEVPAQSGIGSTCSPQPDFIITGDGVRSIEDHNGEAPYAGRWRSRGLTQHSVPNVDLGKRGEFRLAARCARGDHMAVECWCVTITGQREGVRLSPSRATVNIVLTGDLTYKAFAASHHYVEALVNSNGRPASNAQVSFIVRDPAGRVLDFQGMNDMRTSSIGKASLKYINWIPGEHTIEVRAEVDGAVYTDIARVTWVNPCAATETLQGTESEQSTLDAMRSFRDSRLAASERGREYSRLYYKSSTEAVGMMMLNPMMILRSQQMIERYMPVVHDMTAGSPVVLTEGDLQEIDTFLTDFASAASGELRQTVKKLTEDLRNPEVHREFGITIRPGPRRELPARKPLLSLRYAGQAFALFGFFAASLFLIRRRPKIVKALLCLALTASVVCSQFSAFARQSAQTASNNKHSSSRRGPAGALKKQAVSFEANQGQADPQVRFISRGKDFNLYLTPTEAVIRLRDEDRSSGLCMSLEGANRNPFIQGIEKLPATINYFRGDDRSQWRSGVPSYAKVLYKEVFRGVDMLYHGDNGQLEYDFKVAPGADPRAIRLLFDGAESVEIDQSGDLVLRTPAGEIRHRKPVAYQEMNGQRQPVSARYRRHNGRIGFELGEYDRTLPLVIDPVLEYSTYLGGSGEDQGTAMAVDSEGNAYIVGLTNSADLATVNAAQNGFGGGPQDAFVAKLDPSGTRLVYLTYLGGSDLDTPTGLAVDSAGNAYVTGFTRSANFPTLNALQANNRGSFNAFVTRLGPTGNLLYSTYLGGSRNDSGSGIAVDSSGNVYVAGIATSSNFPVINPVQSGLEGASDLFMAKLNSSGSQLAYSTYLGGSQQDAATSIAVDMSGNVYVTGATLSTDFRLANAAQNLHGGGIFDAFVVKLNSSGNQLIYSTYLGGGGSDRGFRIMADFAGAAYIVGDTFSANFPTANALQRSPGGSADAFVTKLNSAGTLVYSTYLGGSGIDGAAAISIGTGGGAYVTGFTQSNDFPTTAPLQQNSGGGDFDAFVAKLSASGSALEYSTYLGGSGTDTGFAIAAGASDRVYVMGLTGSDDFPTVNALQSANAGGVSDLFVAKIRPGPTITRAAIKGKHLDITGSGFEQGAVILLDGQQQKSLFKSGTSLRGKKVGRRIAPGQSVTLEVRNPDGTLSPGFNFSR